MVKQDIPTKAILVAGDPGSAKVDFINRFLHHYPPSAEVRRKNDTIHFVYKAGGDFKIQLHDVCSVKSINREYYQKMDAVVFCYAATDSESLQSLEKWMELNKDEVETDYLPPTTKKTCSFPPGTKKQPHSFLLADVSNVGSQRDVSLRLAEKANKLKEEFGIERFIESSLEDEESVCTALWTILHEISPPKLDKNTLRKLIRVSPETLFQTYLTKIPFPYVLPTQYSEKASSLGSLQLGHYKDIFWFENPHFQKSFLQLV